MLGSDINSTTTSPDTTDRSSIPKIKHSFSVVSETSPLFDELQQTDLPNKTHSKCSHFGFSKQVFLILFCLFTVILSSIVQSNKLYYRFTKQDWNIILFTNENYFDISNNLYKILSLICLCVLWDICIKHYGAEKAIFRLYLEQKNQSQFRSFNSLQIITMIGFIFTYDIMYTFILQQEKWHGDLLDAAEAVSYYNCFCIMTVAISLSLDFDLAKNLNKNKTVKSYNCLQLIIFNLLLINIIIAIAYNVASFIIESKSLLEDAKLFKTSMWNLYGFFNNYLLTGLTKVLIQKLLFHKRSVIPPISQSIEDVNSKMYK